MDVQKRNFIIIWISNFLVAGTMTMIMPFFLFISKHSVIIPMHMFKNGQALFSVHHSSQLLLCHRFGDELPINTASSPSLLINGFGIATSVFLMGFVHSVEDFSSSAIQWCCHRFHTNFTCVYLFSNCERRSGKNAWYFTNG